MIQFDDRLRQTFAALDAGRWADIFRLGLESFQASVRRGDPQPDYEGFGLAALFLERTVPAVGLVELYDQLEIGQSKSDFRAGLVKVLDDMRAPPALETLLIIGDLLKVAGEVRALEAVDVLCRKFKNSPRWRDTPETYHATLQFAYRVATHGDAARLIRALVGPAQQRSACFQVTQLRSVVRVMTTSEPQSLVEHIAFFEPEAGSALVDIQQGLVDEILRLGDQVLDKIQWAAVSPLLPAWFKRAHEAVEATDSVVTAQMVNRLIDQAFATAATEHGRADEPIGTKAQSTLEKALHFALLMGNEALLQAVDRIKPRLEHVPLGRSRAWILDALLAYSGPIRQGIDAFLYVRGAQDVMNRVERHTPEAGQGKRIQSRMKMGLVPATSSDDDSLLRTVGAAARDEGRPPDRDGRTSGGG